VDLDGDDAAGGRSGKRVALARLVFALTVAGLIVGFVISRAAAARVGPSTVGSFSDLGFLVAFGSFAIVGYVLATRLGDNPIGWLALATGACVGLDALLSSYGVYALRGGAGGREVAAVALSLDAPLWLPLVALPTTCSVLLFPDGHLPSPRWRWFAWALGIGLVVVFAAILFSPGSLADSGFPQVQNPFGLDVIRPVLESALVVLLILPIGIVASIVSLIQRYRRAAGIERLQLRWLVSAAAVVGVVYAVVFLLSLNEEWGGATTPGWLAVLQTVAITSFALIPIAIGVSVLRYRLYDIDVVINRAVLFAALGAFITAVYVAIVVGIGTLIGSRTAPVLSAAAAAAVAVAFQPARRRAQRLADRLVYGERATPYEVLAEFSDRLGNAYATDDLLPRMARTLAEATGAARADVYVRVGDELRPDAAWPPDARPDVGIPVGGAAPAPSASTALELVRHQDEVLGAVSVAKKPGEPVTPTEARLVRDLAAQAGLVLRNVRLIEELRASRQRLVSAQDAERRKLERNLHDGAQQQLVALAVQLKVLDDLTQRDPEGAHALVESLQGAAADALDNLRDLARGIYPPLLADKGLIAALESQARKAPLPVTVEGAAIGRYPQDVEAAVYFCSLEALQNTVKYAEATSASVRIAQRDGVLRFEVRDDGKGFDSSVTGRGTGLQGISDRVAAMGGATTVMAAPGKGTTVAGEIPLPAYQPPEH
jgi:signal transduction histidine kinase